jgi:glycosyltransferase involved in cell wall biosynthesis
LRHSRFVAAQAREFGAEALIETHNAISLTGVEASRLAKLPLIVDDVTPPEETASFHSPVLGSLHRMVFGRTMNRAAALVVANDSIGDRLVAAGAPRAKILVVENGFAIEHFFPRPNRDALRTRFGLPTDNFVAAFCGSFQKWHRVDMLVRAFGRAFPEGGARLLLIGDGPEFRATSRLARELLRDRVMMTGGIRNSEVGELLSIADAAVLPATNSYGNPMKLYEFMASGLPIIAPRQKQVVEITGDQAAILFSPGDEDELSCCLRNVAQNEILRKSLGSVSLEQSRNHTWHHRVGTLLGELTARGILRHGGGPA